MKYCDIRDMHWRRQKKVLKEDFNINLDTSPYTYFKTIIYIELSAILVFFLQKTFLTPNFITLIYAFLGVCGGILIGSAQSGLVIGGVLIFFFKSVIDWSDGLLARIRKKTSELGSLLDGWAGFVGYYSFIIGLGLYLYNTTNENHFLYLILTLLSLRVLDLKIFFLYKLYFKSNGKKFFNFKEKNYK